MDNVKIFHSTNLRWQNSTALFETAEKYYDHKINDYYNFSIKQTKGLLSKPSAMKLLLSLLQTSRKNQTTIRQLLHRSASQLLIFQPGEIMQ